MSTFSEKILRGELPGDSDWNDHLLEGHRGAPSQTPVAFAPYKSADGRNSYEIIADEIGKFSGNDLQIVDLACGDGHLIPHLLRKLGPRAHITGIDMSEAELAVARRNINDSRVSLVNGVAQDLPLPDRSVDLVLSHMAFMLMLPLEPVVREIARVLKPGGRFSAVVGHRGYHRGVFAEVAKASLEFLSSRYPMIKEARFGDPRVQSPEGIQSLFTQELGFSAEIERAPFELFYQTAPEGIWDVMEHTYSVECLPSHEKGELKKMLVDLGRKHSDSSGKVRFEFAMIKFSVVKTRT